MRRALGDAAACELRGAAAAAALLVHAERLTSNAAVPGRLAEEALACRTQAHPAWPGQSTAGLTGHSWRCEPRETDARAPPAAGLRADAQRAVHSPALSALLRVRHVHTAAPLCAAVPPGSTSDEGGASADVSALSLDGQAAIDVGAMHAVHTAIACNVAILGAKLSVWAFSGSSSILAESIHSLADIANQVLLRTGIASSLKAPDERSNYGCAADSRRRMRKTRPDACAHRYRRELFVWSLISGVSIFCLGAGVSVVHGVHGLLHPEPLHDIWASMSVIGVSILVESYSLLVAYRALAAGAAARSMPLRTYISEGLDPTSMAIVAEDGGAVLGLALAGGCLLAAGGTGALHLVAEAFVMLL